MPSDKDCYTGPQAYQVSKISSIEKEAYQVVSKISSRAKEHGMDEVDSECPTKSADIEIAHESSNIYRLKIVKHWKYLKENIDPVSLLQKLITNSFLTAKGYGLENKYRSHQATLVLIAALRQIQDSKSFDRFVEILGSQWACLEVIEKTDTNFSCAKISDECAVKHSKRLRDVELKFKSEVQKLQMPGFLLIVDDFVEKFIFGLDDIEYIIHPIQNATEKFFNKIVDHIKDGSYKCLIESLEKNQGNRFKLLISSLKDLPEETTEKVRLKLINSKEHEAGDSESGILTFVVKSANKDKCENAIQKHGVPGLAKFVLENFSSVIIESEKGSVIIRLRCLDGAINEGVKQSLKTEAFRLALQTLMNKKNVRETLSAGTNVVYVRFEVNTGSEKCSVSLDTEPVSIGISSKDFLSANKSFLINEIDTTVIIEAFEKKHIEFFTKTDLDRNDKRVVAAEKLLNTVLARDLSDTLIEIIEGNHHLELLCRRLNEYREVYSSRLQLSELRKNILKNCESIVQCVDIEDCKPTFIERNIFSACLFKGIENENQCQEREQLMAALLAKIIEKGRVAMLTLVDVIYMINLHDIGKGILSVANDSEKTVYNERKGTTVTESESPVKNTELVFEAEFEIELEQDLQNKRKPNDKDAVAQTVISKDVAKLTLGCYGRGKSDVGLLQKVVTDFTESEHQRKPNDSTYIVGLKVNSKDVPKLLLRSYGRSKSDYDRKQKVTDSTGRKSDPCIQSDNTAESNFRTHNIQPLIH